MTKKTKAALVCTAVAGMFAVTACGGATTDNNANTNVDKKEFQCVGGNACKGQGECKGEGHDCAGKGECKGQSFVNVKDSAACDALKAANKG